MRLFVAIKIPKDIRAALASLFSELRDLSPQTKWVRPENMHLTLKFLGETDPSKLSDVQTTLATVRSSQPVSLEFRGLGFFPNAKRPRVLWAGIESAPQMQTIAAEIDQALHALGIPLDDRSFAPHLTVARFSQPVLPGVMHSAVNSNATRSFGSCSAGQFQLIESKLKSSGAEYTTLQSFSFVSEA